MKNMEEVSGRPKRSKKLISMLGEEEEEACLQLEEAGNGDNFDEMMKRSSSLVVVADGAVPATGGIGKRASDRDRVNPEDYPLLAKFLKQEVMADELHKNWIVIGNQNATILEQEWGIIMDKVIEQSIAKMDLILDIYSSINIKDGSDN